VVVYLCGGGFYTAMIITTERFADCAQAVLARLVQHAIQVNCAVPRVGRLNEVQVIFTVD
jgi:hypothetical protein